MMTLSIPYQPREEDDAFEMLLRSRYGFRIKEQRLWTHDPRVILPCWLMTPTGKWYDEHLFLELFDDRVFRTLLRGMLTFSEWNSPLLEAFLHAKGVVLSEQQLLFLIEYCQDQEFVQWTGTCWKRGQQLEGIRDLGSTFEWAVLQLLRTQHHMLARRAVVLEDFGVPGDLDVLALDERLSLLVECKSRSSCVGRKDLDHFLQRVEAFHPDIGLLLIDTISEESLKSRVQGIGKLRVSSRRDRIFRQIQGQSVIYRVCPHVYVANTAGGIRTSLHATLRLGRV